MPNCSNNVKKIIVSVWGSIFKKNHQMARDMGLKKPNKYFISPSLYPSGLRMNDITGTSGANLLITLLSFSIKQPKDNLHVEN